VRTKKSVKTIEAIRRATKRLGPALRTPRDLASNPGDIRVVAIDPVPIVIDLVTVSRVVRLTD